MSYGHADTINRPDAGMSRRQYMQQFHARRRAATAANGGIAPTDGHGTIATATNWSCRCDPCMQAKAALAKRAKADRFARTAANGGIAPVDVHGVRSTYTDWGCKCPACRAASAEYSRRRRQLSREAS